MSILHENNKIRILKDFEQRNIRPLKSIIMHMSTVLGLGSLRITSCLNAAWHGCYQPVALLTCYGRPGSFNSCLQLCCIVNVPHLSLGNAPQILCWVRAKSVCWPINHSNPVILVTEPYFGTFGSVGRCQVLQEN